MVSGALTSNRHKEKEYSKHLIGLSAEWSSTDKYYKYAIAKEYKNIRGSSVALPVRVIQKVQSWL